MNKIFISLAMGLSLMTVVSKGQQLSIGLDLGTNLMPVEKDDLGKVYKPTFNGGAFVDYDFTNHFRIRSGIYYSQKTHTTSQLDTGLLNLFGLEDQLPAGIPLDLSTYSVEKSRIAQFYVELPVLATYKLEWFSVYMGPYFGYMVNTNRATSSSTTIPFLQTVDLATLDPTGGILTAILPPAYSEDFNQSSSDAGLKKLELGLRAGIGMEFNNIGVNMAYNYGFLRHRMAVQTGDNKPYSYVQVSINYKFSFARRN